MIPNDDETIKRTLFMFPWRINDENSHEWTLLLEGTYKHSIILDFLLHVDNKQLNKRNRDNKTPLHWAPLFGYIDCVSVLLSNGADRKMKDYYKHTA